MTPRGHPSRRTVRDWDKIRDKIRASELINRLQAHADGILGTDEGLKRFGPHSGKEMTDSQVRAAFGLLKKVLPDKIHVEGNVNLTLEQMLVAIQDKKAQK